MSVVEAENPRAIDQETAIATRTIVALWIASALLLVLFLGIPAVTRTQEARVLETARQMLGHPAHDWLVPKLNGTLRLQKPPLAYWLSGASFSIGHVNEFWGRLPTVILGWLTLATIYLAGKWLFGQRAGLLAACALLGSVLFLRHTRLAETDAPAMLFVTVAILAIWRAADESAFGRQAGWLHLGMGSTGLAILSKGAPGAFPILYLVGLILIERRGSLAVALFKSGAILTLVVVALPWFAYVGASEGWGTFIDELRNNAEGGNHSASVFQYVPDLFVACAPWSGIVPVAVWAAIEQRRDVRLRRVLIWLCSIAVPLCLIGNKQKHYVLPLMPPLMLLAGWTVDRAIDERHGVFGIARKVLLATLIVMVAGSAGVLVGTRISVGAISGVDVVLACAMLALTVMAGWLWRARGAARGIAALLASSAVVMPIVVGLWVPEIVGSHVRETAATLVQNFGDGPYVFVGNDISLPLCWAMKHEIDQVESESEALAAAREHPSLAVLALGKDKRTPPALGAPFVPKLTIQSEDRVLQVYQLARK